MSDTTVLGVLGTHITLLSVTSPPVTVVAAGQGLQGAPGPGGFASRDLGNTLSMGTDGGLYAPAMAWASDNWQGP